MTIWGQTGNNSDQMGPVLIETPSRVGNGGRSEWFVGVLVLRVNLIFALTRYPLPLRG